MSSTNEFYGIAKPEMYPMHQIHDKNLFTRKLSIRCFSKMTNNSGMFFPVCHQCRSKNALLTKTLNEISYERKQTYQIIYRTPDRRNCSNGKKTRRLVPSGFLNPCVISCIHLTVAESFSNCIGSITN